MKDPKKHHYISRFLLDGFTDDAGKLWVYENGKPPRVSTPGNSGYEKYFYAFEQDGARNLVAERVIADLEAYTAPTIRRIRSGHLVLNAQERNDIAGFVALTFTRTPFFHDNLDRICGEFTKHRWRAYARAPGVLENAYEELQKESSETLDVSVERVREFALSDRYTMTQENRGWTIQQMFKQMLLIQNMVENMQWSWLQAADGEYFVTSDNPVAVVGIRDSGNPGIASGETQFTFPIDQKLCLYGQWGGKQLIVKISPAKTREVNKRTIFRAYRFVYAPENSTKLERVVNEIHGARRWTMNSMRRRKVKRTPGTETVS